MSTINVAYNDAAWALLGGPTDFGDFDTGPGAYEFDTLVTGSSINVRVFGTQSCNVWVDGTLNTITGPGSGWNWVTVSLGADAAHDVRIGPTFWNKGNAGDNNVVQVTGASPSVSANLFGTIYQQSNFSGHFIADGESSVEGTGEVLWPQPGCGLRFDANVTQATFYVRDDSASAVLIQDGNYSSPVGTINTPGPGVGGASRTSYTFKGLSGAHTYELVPIGVPTLASPSPPPFRLWMIAFGVGETVTANTQAAKINRVMYGDSIASGYGVTDIRKHYWFILCRQWGVSPVLKGNISQPVFTFLRDNTAQLTNIANVDLGVTQGGINDKNGVGGTVATSDFQAAYVSQIENIRAVSGFGTIPLYLQKIIAEPIASEPGGDYTLLNSFNSCIVAANTTLSDPNNTVVDLSAGWDPAVDETGPPHPDDAGHALLAQNLSEAVGPTMPTIGTSTANSASQITVTWTAGSGSNDGYNIQYSTDSTFATGVQTVTAAGGSTSKAVTGLTASTTYYFRTQSKVTTVPRVSLWSGSTNATTNASGPTVASAATDGANLTLTLSGGTSPYSFTGGATTATGSLFAEHSFAGVHCTGANATISSNTITCPLAVPIGQGQTVPSIDSTNLHGLEDAAATAIPAFSSLTVANTSTIVAATPADFTLTPFANRVAVSWTADRDCNTNVATKIYRSTNGTDFTLRTTLSSQSNAFNDTTAVNGTQYWYYATREYFGSGHVSAASSTVTTQPPNGVPVFTSVAMVPTIVRLSNGGTQTFAPVALDQFGAAMASQPSFTYSIDLGGGSFAGAVYTSDGALAVVRATASGISGVAIVNRKTSLRNRSRSCSRERTS